MRSKINLSRWGASVEKFDILVLTEAQVDTTAKNVLSGYEVEVYQLHYENTGKEGRRGGYLHKREIYMLY